MHIVLGVLGVVVTILVLLNRLQEGGIDIGWLNPFSWHRRRTFRNKYHTPAAYSLDSPMDVAALYMVAIAKADGDITREQKNCYLSCLKPNLNYLLQNQKTCLAQARIPWVTVTMSSPIPKQLLPEAMMSFPKNR